MDMIKVNFVFLVAVLFVCLLGFLFKKTKDNKNNRFKKNDSSFTIMTYEALRYNFHYLVLFFVVNTLLASGMYYLADEVFYASGEDVGSSCLTLSFFATAGFFYWANQKLKDLRLLESIIKIAASTNKDFLTKLKRANPSNYLAERDIPLSLILEKQGENRSFLDYSGGTTMDNFFDRWQDSMSGPQAYQRAKEIIEDLKSKDRFNWSYIYDILKEFDQTIHENIPERLIKKYPRDIYFFQLNLLEMILPYIVKGEYLILGEAQKGEEVVNDFCKHILNEYYTNRKHKDGAKGEYSPQENKFSMQKFQDYLNKTN